MLTPLDPNLAWALAIAVCALGSALTFISLKKLWQVIQAGKALRAAKSEEQKPLAELFKQLTRSHFNWVFWLFGVGMMALAAFMYLQLHRQNAPSFVALSAFFELALMAISQMVATVWRLADDQIVCNKALGIEDKGR